MALAKEKLRILTFPQHISGDKLNLNVLLLPTQGLLNLEATFPSQLNPGSTVQLPTLISGDLQLELKAIKGLSSYPFSDATALTDEGQQWRPSRPVLLFQVICLRSMKDWPALTLDTAAKLILKSTGAPAPSGQRWHP
jgi:hypothetical protein